MAGSFVQVPPDSTGKKIATNEVGGEQYQVVNLADSSGNSLVQTDGATSLDTAIAVGGQTAGGVFKVLEVNASGYLNIADGGGSITVDSPTLASESTLTAVLAKQPQTFDSSNGMPDYNEPCIAVRQLPQRIIATSYASAGAGVDTTQETLISIGTGMAVNRTGGNLVITTGTTANSELVIRSVFPVDGRVTFSFGDTLSQRIANNNFFRELVDVIGDGLAYNIVNTTTVDVTKAAHGFTAANVGQRMDLCAITGAAGVPQEGVIASIPDANTIRFTVAGWPATGTGTLSLTGWNKIEVLYTGTAATTVNINTRRRGYQNTSTGITTSTTASGAMQMLTVQNDRVTVSNGTLAVGSTLTDRSVVFTNIPEPDTQFYYQIRARNGTTAPASTTTWTCAFTRVQDFIATQVELTGMRQFGLGAVLPVSGAVTATLGAGTAAVGDIGVQYRANSTGAASFTNFVALGTTNATVLKASAGRLLGYHLTNNATAVRYVKLHNSATAPTAGAGVVGTIGIPPNGGTVFMQYPGGMGFATGIALTTVTGASATDATAVAANDIVGTFVWA